MSLYSHINEEFAIKFLAEGTSTILADWVSWLRQQELFQLGIAVGTPYENIFTTDFRFLTELSICYYYNKNYKKAFQCSVKILNQKLDENLLSSVLFNAHFCIPHIQDNYIGYPTSLPINSSKFGLVTFTMTTCKRYDLFEKSLNSFINCCTDIHLIDRWICIDDNSSTSDRILMQDKYPFMEFIFKDSSEKGHAQSMNKLYTLDQITTPWIFHMEDDWQFYIPDNYITKCIQVLQENPKYGQCLVNKNYAETFEDIRIIGGITHETSLGMRYYEHEYDTKKYQYHSNCSYWPHYSLRVGMTRRALYQEIGKFNESASHFEMEYAHRYVSAGYKTTFLEFISVIHIGRLTSERTTDKENAYTLNDELQFVDKKNTKIFVINLEQRPDRYEKFVSGVAGKFDFQRYNAIDGNLLQPTQQLEQLFNDNDYNYRRGMIGCALSHIDLWIQLTNQTDQVDRYIILEDDVDIMCDNFTEKCELLRQNTPADIIFLGHHAIQKPLPNSSPVVEKWNSARSLSESFGGTGGYIITKTGASKMLAFLQEHGMPNAIDTMMQHACDILQVYYIEPHLVWSECAVMGNINEIDSDIQRDYNSLKRPIYQRLWDEKKYFEELDIPMYEFLTMPSTFSADIVSIVHTTEFPSSAEHFIYRIGDAIIVVVPSKYDYKNYRLLTDGKFSMNSLIA